MLLVYPPKFCITIVSNFSWVLQSPQEKSTTMVTQNFGGQTTCIMAYVRMVNSEHFCQSLGSSLFRGATVSWSLEQTMISRFALLRLPLLSKSKMATTRGEIWLSVLPKCSFRVKKQLIHVVENLKKKEYTGFQEAQSPKEGKIFQIHILTFQALSITLFVIDERYQLVTGKSQ